jgi:hypothetical protein
MDGEVFTTSGTSATLKFRSDDFNLTNRNPWFSSFLVSNNLRYKGNPDRNHKFWNFVSIEVMLEFATYKWKVHNGKIEIIFLP